MAWEGSATPLPAFVHDSSRRTIAFIAQAKGQEKVRGRDVVPALLCGPPAATLDQRDTATHNECVKPADLTEPEQLLWKAFSGGKWVDLGSGAAGPAVIRAEVIAALLLGAAEAEPGGTAGIRLRGATVTGCLDLRAGSVAWPLVCDGCQFDTEIGFVDSALRTVCILNSGLPALDGTRLRLTGILDMTGSQVAGTVQLQQARVDGQLRLCGVRVGAGGTGAVAVLARGLSVAGEADCPGMEARGLVSFEGAA